MLERLEIDQAEYGAHDDGGQYRLRQVVEIAGEKENDYQDRQCADNGEEAAFRAAFCRHC